MYTIKKEGAEVLREQALKVDVVDSSCIRLINEMTRMMIKAGGCGLAAPQIGISKAIIITIPGRAFINPEIIQHGEGMEKMTEGCLSCYEKVEVERWKEIEVKYTNMQGIERVEKFSGMFARIIQHEVDHLKGKLIVDYKNV